MTTLPEFEALRQRLARSAGRRPLLGALAALPLAGASALLPDDDAAAKRKRAQAEKKKKPRKYPVCLNGQTINGSKKKMKKLLKKGATHGKCPAVTTTPAPCVPRNWTPQATFGTQGNGDSQLNAPGGLALASNARTLLIADTGNSRISVWTRPTTASTLWTNHTTFSQSGSTDTDLNAPADVALSADGLTAWVADGGNNRISVWARASASSDTWTHAYNVGSSGNGTGQLNGPAGVTVSPDTKTIWVADGGNNRISVWTRPSAASSTWTNVITFGTSGSNPNQLAFPAGITISTDTLTTWVADLGNNRISIWTRPTAASTTWTNAGTFGTLGDGPAQLHDPSQPALDAGELTMWIADVRNDRISIWTRPSTSSHSWSPLATVGGAGFGPLQMGDPFGVAISPDGATLLASDFLNSRVVTWSVDCPA